MIFEHRYVMENIIGRPLTEYEIVHHKNGDILDNRPENLDIMTRGKHTVRHNTGKSRKGQPHKPWTPEQREIYLIALKKRHPPTEETKHKISETMKRVRSEERERRNQNGQR